MGEVRGLLSFARSLILTELNAICLGALECQIRCRNIFLCRICVWTCRIWSKINYLRFAVGEITHHLLPETARKGLGSV